MQILTRPITMLIFEPIISSTAVYISFAYSLVFFYFQAYPIIFGGKVVLMQRSMVTVLKMHLGVYGFSVEQTSLTLIPSASTSFPLSSYT
jgi:hypothetical protein